MTQLSTYEAAIKLSQGEEVDWKEMKNVRTTIVHLKAIRRHCDQCIDDLDKFKETLNESNHR